jgi:hypothetical protein
VTIHRKNKAHFDVKVVGSPGSRIAHPGEHIVIRAVDDIRERTGCESQFKIANVIGGSIGDGLAGDAANHIRGTVKLA